MTLEEFALANDLIKKKEVEKVVLLAYFAFFSSGVDRFQTRDAVKWFEELHLAAPNVYRLRTALQKSRKVIRSSDGSFRLHASTIEELKHLLQNETPNKSGRINYVDQGRIEELRKSTSQNFDLTKLIRLIDELNQNFRNENFLTVAILCRAIIDHIPPIFGCSSFAEIANNYAGSKSFKESMTTLSTSLRKIGDSHLHTQIRKKEVLPNRTQVDFSNDMDVLLAEIVRIMK
jgi:hypothetical protein